jgi:hypothetical protein
MPTIVYTQTFDVDDGSPEDASNWSRVTSPTFAGAGALRINPTGAVGYWHKNAGATPATFVYRVWLRFDTKPSSNLNRVVNCFAGGVGEMALGFDSTANKFGIFDGGAIVNTGGPSISASQWYRIDLRVNASANPWVVDAQVDSSALTQTTGAYTASTFNRYDLGTDSESLTYDLIFDSLDVSHTGADYPITDAPSTATLRVIRSNLRW